MTVRQPQPRMRRDNEKMWASRIFGRHLVVVVFLALAFFLALFLSLYFSRNAPPARIALPAVPAIIQPEGDPSPQPGVLQRHRQSRSPFRIGIVAGHRGFDSGAVCPDGLTEAQINQDIALRVIARLNERNIEADLLDEYDNRQAGYPGNAIVSLHADSCVGGAETLSGYKTAASSAPAAIVLQSCIEQAYGATTGLTYNTNTITNDMISYHLFRKVSADMPAIILEMGFMSRDRELLTSRADIPAEGIVQGILCFIERIQ